jgi:hypothetical protein
MSEKEHNEEEVDSGSDAQDESAHEIQESDGTDSDEEDSNNNNTMESETPIIRIDKTTTHLLQSKDTPVGPIPFNVEKECFLLLLEARIILREIMEQKISFFLASCFHYYFFLCL